MESKAQVEKIGSMQFILSKKQVLLEYEPRDGYSQLIWDNLKNGATAIRKVFFFERGDLIEEPDEEELAELEEFAFHFRFARDGKAYYKILGRKLGIDNSVWIARDEVNWRPGLFMAIRDISIFKRIAKLVPPNQKIIIGGAREGAIPVDVFEDLIKRFPNTYEINRYAETRITNVIGDYLDPQRDYRAQYEKYLSTRKSPRDDEPLRAEVLLDHEIDKFELVRDTVLAWLSAGDRSEDQWQKQMIAFLPLIFPKYVAVLEKVPVDDRYTRPGELVRRELDIALVDANGNLDVVEIKRPMDDVLLRKTRYRDNHVPTGELSGTIMQAEKYLFHLSKGGIAMETKITEKFEDRLPSGLEVRVTNPKALLILGRDRRSDGTAALSPAQTADLAIIKRKYANMIDIITYDDLIRRLEAIIESLRRRKREGLDTTKVERS